MYYRKSIYLFAFVVFMAGCSNSYIDSDSKATPADSNIFNKVENISEGLPDSEEEIKGLCEVLDKIENLDLEKYNSLNRMLHSNSDESQQSLFCIDKDTGVVYFVNQNKDWFVYRLKEGSAELVVNLPAKELWMWDGVVYFMIASHDTYELNGMQEGDIYAYTPADGSVKLIYSVSEKGDSSQKLAVYESGIYFSCSKVLETEKNNENTIKIATPYYGLLHFGGNEVIEDTMKMTFLGWKDFCFVRRKDGVYFQNRTDRSEIRLGNFISYCVFEDTLYCVTRENPLVLLLKDLETENEIVYDCEMAFAQVVGDIPENAGISTFTVADGNIWASIGGVWLFQIESQSGEITCYRTCGERGVIKRLYTDGNRVYATYSAVSVTDGYPVRVITEQPEWDETLGVHRLNVEPLTE